MTICLGKSCSFGLLCSFVNVYLFVCAFQPLSFEVGVWDLIVLVPDHCLQYLIIVSSQ